MLEVATWESGPRFVLRTEDNVNLARMRIEEYDGIKAG
jgi:hypothetical protein